MTCLLLELVIICGGLFCFAFDVDDGFIAFVVDDVDVISVFVDGREDANKRELLLLLLLLLVACLFVLSRLAKKPPRLLVVVAVFILVLAVD